MKVIALEGIDGAGKSTQAKRLYRVMRGEGLPVALYNYSAKNNPWGRMIKQVYAGHPVLKHVKHSRYLQETLYAFSSRANLRALNGEIQPDTVLLADRSIVTAYASHIDRLPFWFLDVMEAKVRPDLAVFLDIQPEAAAQRICDRPEKFEEELDDLRLFREGYERVMGKDKPKVLQRTQFLRVNATLPESELTDIIYKEIRSAISQKEVR